MLHFCHMRYLAWLMSIIREEREKRMETTRKGAPRAQARCKESKKNKTKQNSKKQKYKKQKEKQHLRAEAKKKCKLRYLRLLQMPSSLVNHGLK